MNDKKSTFPHPNVELEIAWITPERAAYLLSTSPGNRSMKRALLNKLVNALQGGRFKFNGESISVDEQGRLMEGHHRLTACVQSGVPFWTVMVSGVPRDAMATINTGAARTIGDYLTIEGVGGNTDGAIASTLIRADLGGLEAAFMSGGGRFPVDNVQISERLQSEPWIHDVAKRAKSESAKCGLTPRIYGALYCIFSEINGEDADEFFSKLATGAGLEAGDPILTLRNGLLSARGMANSKGRLADTVVAAHVIKSWNKFRAGERLSIFRYRTAESFPHPL